MHLHSPPVSAGLDRPPHGLAAPRRWPRFAAAVGPVLAAAALLTTLALCVGPLMAAALLGLGLGWVTPGVVALARLYARQPSGRMAAALLGAPLGYAFSSLVLLAAWSGGARSALWLGLAPLFATLVVVAVPLPRVPWRVPRFSRRDVVILGWLLLLVPIIVARPYTQVGRDLPEGRAYRAYFTADFVWAMAVVSEVSKGDMLPRNPFDEHQPLHYYWLAHLFPAVEHRLFGSALRLDHLLLGNAVLAGGVFVAFLYGLAKHVTRDVPAAALGTVASVLFTSPEGAYALFDLYRHARPLSLVRYLNIDAVSRWFFGALPIDGLQRLLLYQPQHQLGYALACLALIFMLQQPRRPTVVAAAAAGVALAGGFLISTFSALMVSVMVALIGAVYVVRARAWAVGAAQAVVGAVPIVGALFLSRVLQYVTGAGQLVDITANPLAVRHAILGPALSLGPILVTLVVGLARWPRAWHRTLLLPGVSLIVCAFFYFFVDVRDHQDVYVGWRAGHLLLITSAGLVGWTWWRLMHRGARRWASGGMAVVLVLVGVTAPTTLIDLYNTQDISNREMAAGFPWTLVLGHDELKALQWIARQTPLDARVQVDPVARDPGTWCYIPAFGERRMAAGLPISMIPLAPYQAASDRVRRLYDITDPVRLRSELQALAIDVLVVGPEERRRHPGCEEVLARAATAFPALFRTRNVTLYAASGRMRELARTGRAPS